MIIKKVIKIESIIVECVQCPYLYEDESSDRFCYQTKKKLYNIYTIPEWCTLEDHEEQILN